MADPQIVRYGSCNAQEFLVHDTCMAPAAVGAELEAQKQIWFFGRRSDQVNFRLLRATAPGQQWGWNYYSPHTQPQLQIVRDSNNSIVYVWEAESPPDFHLAERSHILETDDYGRSYIPSGGSAVKVALPNGYDLETIEDEVEAADLPTWITYSDRQYASPWT